MNNIPNEYTSNNYTPQNTFPDEQKDKLNNENKGYFKTYKIKKAIILNTLSQ